MTKFATMDASFNHNAFAGLAAILLYVASGLWQTRAILRGVQVNSTLLLAAGFTAVLVHGIHVLGLIHTTEGIQLGFFQVSSLIFWVICTVLVVSSLQLPVQNLFALLFPLSALGILCSILFQSRFVPEQHISLQIGWHILLSILAYSVLTIATVQALALALQDNLLRKKHFQGPLRVLPPLQTMEALLFEMLWAGTVLLTLSLVTGFLFFENIREQHLSHKMAFSTLAWLIYAILLWGRAREGWRGRKAIHWTLGGFAALMLAYFGSKFVLELLLS